MSRPISYDLIDMVFHEVGIRKARMNVIKELNGIIEDADTYCRENVEYDEGDEWDGSRCGNDEWEYAFWEYLLD